jgi:hypothetical protein
MQGKQPMPSKKIVIKTYLQPEENLRIAASAAQAGLSKSSFVKLVSLGEQVRSLDTQRSIRAMVNINGDLGRLGGLLKLWLTERDNNAVDVRRVLRELEARQRELKQAIKKLELV